MATVNPTMLSGDMDVNNMKGSVARFWPEQLAKLEFSGMN
jgi:hypothetical protein